ncbi:hypothetical protein TNCV_2715891 [Trichonephila clavipes]|nr:hypothetical protein TNCV_2715891 [Trichonephila clavipes]
MSSDEDDIRPDTDSVLSSTTFQCRPTSMMDMNLGLLPSGFGFKSRVRHGRIFFEKRSQTSTCNGFLSRIESRALLPVICWDHHL